jgi:hypothetical protein
MYTLPLSLNFCLTMLILLFSHLISFGICSFLFRVTPWLLIARNLTWILLENYMFTGVYHFCMSQSEKWLRLCNGCAVLNHLYKTKTTFELVCAPNGIQTKYKWADRLSCMWHYRLYYSFLGLFVSQSM